MTTAGVQVAGTDGSIFLDASMKVFKRLGQFTIISQQDGSLVDSRIGGKEISFNLISITSQHDGGANNNIYPKYIKVESDTISWEFRRNAYATARDQTVYELTFEYGWYA